MDEKKFKGVFTAIITPFKTDESVDYDALGKLIEFQIKNGVAGVVPCGTTGESPTLNHDEHKKVIEFVIKRVNKRCFVIAGTGSNCTKEAVELSMDAERAGADGLLLVNPYYNKPTQEGLFLHFKKIADSVKIPVVVYNIKGRTGVNVETPTLMRIISACPNVIAVKEASGDLNQMKDVISKAPAYFSVLSGDDNMTLSLIKAGGVGIISVASNAVPSEIVKMVDFALGGDFSEAEKINSSLASFFENIFIETNPIPIKFVLAQKRMCEEVYRLPMCEMTKGHKEKVSVLIKQMGLI